MQAFRDQMVELVRSGRTPSELSKEFGCHTTSILSKVRQAGGTNATTLPANVAALNAQERQDLIELSRKLFQAQMERDILARAALDLHLPRPYRNDGRQIGVRNQDL